MIQANSLQQMNQGISITIKGDQVAQTSISQNSLTKIGHQPRDSEMLRLGHTINDKSLLEEAGRRTYTRTSHGHLQQ